MQGPNQNLEAAMGIATAVLLDGLEVEEDAGGREGATAGAAGLNRSSVAHGVGNHPRRVCGAAWPWGEEM